MHTNTGAPRFYNHEHLDDVAPPGVRVAWLVRLHAASGALTGLVARLALLHAAVHVTIWRL
jgi:hypothetical protein